MSELYVLTDSSYTPQSSIYEQVRELLLADIKFIQYRNKNEKHDIGLLKDLSNLCKDFGAKFIINDDPNLAKKVGACGVHLGKKDTNLIAARDILGYEAYIGVSCYNDLNLALNAMNNGASYVAFGALYHSNTKPKASICDMQTIKNAKEILNIPICLIGGINISNIKTVDALNPDLIAIVSAAYIPNNICENIKSLHKNLRK